MNILLTNDDGYKAEGINYLKKYFTNKGHNVIVVAPESERSGMSHSITIRKSIKVIKYFENVWGISGSPADCVSLALNGLVNMKIDLVVSGINHGPNIGRDIQYSGTVACARQSGFNGVPAIAFSLNSWDGPYYFDIAGYFLDKNFVKLIENPYDNYFYNVNLPNIPLDQFNGSIKKTVPCKKHYNNGELIYFDPPYPGRYYWIGNSSPYQNIDNNSDAHAVRSECISVSLINVFPISQQIEIDFS